MPTYTAPVEDMMFLFEKLRNNKEYNELEKYKEVTPDLVKDILQEAAKINQNLILPLAKVGDENPAILENGVVRTPPGYKQAYKKYIEDGWTSLSCDPKYGGQGMPKTVSAFFDEMLSSASLSFKLYSELSIGAYNCINHHASEEIKNKYLPKIVEGKWSGTMCLTEPVCGTDLGLLKTKAKKQSDGTFKLTGQKIFITSGDHDLTENIIHLVLARVDDSPAGTKGISLFLVPKFIVKENGNVGPRNGISTGSIETKMGIKGSATCVLNFDEATGYMIGDKEKGLSAMFTMMNLERIVVGIQGLGISEIAYQNSLSYAKERKQGKSNNSKSKNGADFIIEHADIRRSLLNMKSLILFPLSSYLISKNKFFPSPVLLIVFKNCFGIIISVSIFTIGKYAGILFNVENFCINFDTFLHHPNFQKLLLRLPFLGSQGVFFHLYLVFPQSFCLMLMHIFALVLIYQHSLLNT